MRQIRFRIEGELPPKKDGANSMWGKATEARRLIALRTGALKALRGQQPLSTNISLTLRVHVGPINDQRSGDLDNYVTGVFDGLMAANPRSSIHPSFQDPKNAAVHPSICIAIIDDSEVISMAAEKLAGEGELEWYEIDLQGT